MKEFRHIIKDEAGIHARPASKLVKEVSACESKVTIVKGDKEAEGTKLIKIMGLGAKFNDEIIVRVEGPDEDMAAERLEKFLNENL